MHVETVYLNSQFLANTCTCILVLYVTMSLTFRHDHQIRPSAGSWVLIDAHCHIFALTLQLKTFSEVIEYIFFMCV